MFSSIKLAYNISNINCIINEIYELDDNNLDLELVNEKLQYLKELVFKCGCIGIKFTQWYISRINTHTDKISKIITDYFDDIFDNCPTHSLDETRQLFFKSFGIYMDDIIDMDTIELIGSGSIGQVYKAKFKKGDKIIAIKVKHPNVDNEISMINPIIYTLSKLQNINYFRNRYKLYCNFDEFLKNLKLQINFINEAFNCIRFKNLFVDNPLIYVPTIYYFTQDILISEYVDGDDYYNLSDYGKLKTAYNLFCFAQESILINNFIHGDLHKKNWKVKLVDNKYQLVLYDFGICFRTLDVELGRKIWHGFENQDIRTVIDIFKKHLIIGNFTQEISDEIEEIYQYFTSQKFDMNVVINKIISIMSKKENVMLDQSLLNIIIYFNLIEKIFIENDIISSELKNDVIGYSNIARNMRFELLSYCKANNSYHKLVNYLKNKLDNDVAKSGFSLFSEVSVSDLVFTPPE